jgi:hypothetical protein
MTDMFLSSKDLIPLMASLFKLAIVENDEEMETLHELTRHVA